MTQRKRPKAKQVYDYGTHEVLHTASVLFDSWERQIMDHARLKENPKWKKQAQKAFDEMFKLYAMIGTKKP